MEARRATNPKWAPKETSQNELREVKRPVNNINNILSEERGALWCFNLSFFPSCAAFFAAFAEICGRLPFPRSLKQKRAVSCCWILLLHPVLILIWSDSPKSLRHLRGHGQDCSRWHWYNNQRPMQPIAVWFLTIVSNAQLEEKHLKCCVTSDEFNYSLCTHRNLLKPFISAAFLNSKLQLNHLFKNRKTSSTYIEVYCLI